MGRLKELLAYHWKNSEKPWIDSDIIDIPAGKVSLYTIWLFNIAMENHHV